MSPFELLGAINQELDGQAPKLSAAVNKALMYHGEGRIITDASGNPDPGMTIEEKETVRAEADGSHRLMLALVEATRLLEMNSRWRLIVDVKSPGKDGRTELRYSLIRDAGLAE
ncbi:MAG: hypothetical protein ACLFRG_01195 [Desulfococcaceae bacterium]